MVGTFACPECGNTLELTGLSPGREVCCGWCRTWVEVPYLPRKGRPVRSRRSSRRPGPWVRWAWIGASVLAALILLVGASRMFRTRSRSAHEKAMADLIASAEADAGAGRLEPALVGIEGALAVAGRIDPPEPARVEALRRRRDQLARRAAEARLAALPGLDPPRAVGEARTLLARVRRDPALGALEEAALEQLDRARRRAAEADLAAARRALADRPAETLALCERLAETALELPRDVRDRTLAEAEALAARVIEPQGALIEPVRGSFSLGTPLAYAAALDPLFADALRDHGYLPRPARTNWAELWDRLAPFRASIEVAESQSDETYLQSRNRISRIEVKLTLSRDGAPFWQHRLVGRTREALPRLPAYQASRISVGDRRSAEFERLLYDDARAHVIEKVIPVLRSLPERSPRATSRPDS